MKFRPISCVFLLMRLAVASQYISREDFDSGLRDLYRVVARLEDTVTGLQEDVMALQINSAKLERYPAGEIAFTAKAGEDRNYQAGEVVQYTEVLANVGGAYNATTGVFTCPMPGVYLFSATVYSQEMDRMVVDLVKNTEILLRGATNDGDYEQGLAGVAVVECDIDDTVWVECVFDESHLFGPDQNSFTGVFLGDNMP